MSHRNAQVALRLGGSLSLVVFPSLFMLVFLLHMESFSEVLQFRLAHEPYVASEIMDGLIDRPRSWRYYVLPHLVGYISMPFLIAAALCLGYILFESRPWTAIVGTTMSCIGAVFMGGMLAMWLSFDAVGNVAPSDVVGAIPALEELIAMQGPLLVSTVLTGLSLLGLMVLSIGLFLSRVVPRWAAAAILLGSLMMSTFIDVDNLMLAGALITLAGMVPIAWQFAFDG
jgi:hypothetical protein